jgi:hypothetical protein
VHKFMLARVPHVLIVFLIVTFRRLLLTNINEFIVELQRSSCPISEATFVS